MFSMRLQLDLFYTQQVCPFVCTLVTYGPMVARRLEQRLVGYTFRNLVGIMSTGSMIMTDASSCPHPLSLLACVDVSMQMMDVCT